MGKLLLLFGLVLIVALVYFANLFITYSHESVHADLCHITGGVSEIDLYADGSGLMTCKGFSVELSRVDELNYFNEAVTTYIRVVFILLLVLIMINYFLGRSLE